MTHFSESTRKVIAACATLVVLALVAWGFVGSLKCIETNHQDNVARINACKSSNDVANCLRLNR